MDHQLDVLLLCVFSGVCIREISIPDSAMTPLAALENSLAPYNAETYNSPVECLVKLIDYVATEAC
jgi:hypothetical protein